MEGDLHLTLASNARDKVAPHVTVLKTSCGPMKNFNYLVVNPLTRAAVIVDPSWQMELIEEAVALSRAQVKSVLLTHSHPDHTDLAIPVAEKYGCSIRMSHAEIAASGFRASQLVGVGAESWEVGSMVIEPILSPGHTPGCTCYLIGDNLFSGDVLFAEGCGLCSNIHAAHAMFASLSRLKARLNLSTRIFPGHSYGRPPGLSLAVVAKENLYLQFSDPDSFAAFRLRKGQDRAKWFQFS